MGGIHVIGCFPGGGCRPRVPVEEPDKRTMILDWLRTVNPFRPNRLYFDSALR